MQGKLYKESKNIYEDEARLLFNYFSAAADRIISEEDEANEAMEGAKAEECACMKAKSKHCAIFLVLLSFALAFTTYAFFFLHNQNLVIVGAIASLIILLSLLVMQSSDKKKLSAASSSLSSVKFDFDNIRRDYKVSKLGVAYVPVAKKVPFDKQSIMIDLSGAVRDRNFELISIREPDKFESDVDSLKKRMAEVPLVEGSSMASNVDTADFSISMQEVPMYDYLAGIDKDIRAIDEDLDNVDTKAVSLPVISPGSETMEFLRICGTTEPADYPVVDVFDSSFLDSKVAVLLDIYKQRTENANTGDEKALESLISFIGVSTEAIADSKMNCCTAILEYNDGIFANVLKSAYRNYSPKLEAETIEEIKGMTFDFSDMSENYRPFRFKDSSLMKFDLYSDSWIDETGFRTSIPFGMHQIQEEIFMPIVSNLMEENRIERRKIYERIQTQKLDYLNKWHTETQDFYGRNRDTADVLKSNIIEALSTYNSSYATWKAIKNTIERMDAQQALLGGKVESDNSTAASMVVASEQVNSNFQKLEKEFDSYMERLQDDIDEKADSFGRITYYEALLYASEAKKTAVASSSIHKFDERELKVAKASPYLAEYGTLPPQPNVEEEVYSMLDLNLADEARTIIKDLHGGDTDGNAPESTSDSRVLSGDDFTGESGYDGSEV